MLSILNKRISQTFLNILKLENPSVTFSTNEKEIWIVFPKHLISMNLYVSYANDNIFHKKKIKNFLIFIQHFNPR